MCQNSKCQNQKEKKKKQAAKLWNSLSQRVTGTLTQPYLVAEDFNLTVGSVDRFVTPVIVAVGVNLKIQGQAFNSLLRGEIRAEAVHRNENLQKRKAAPVSRNTQTPGQQLSKGLLGEYRDLNVGLRRHKQDLLSSERSSKIHKKQYYILNSLYEALQGTKPFCPE